MTNFEKITASPEALGEFLVSLSVETGPWDEEFHLAFCDGCQAENCDAENCQRRYEIVRKRRRNFVVFRRGGG